MENLNSNSVSKILVDSKLNLIKNACEFVALLLNILNAVVG